MIANKHSHEPDAEDAANILRVISIKNFRASVRVIIQILNYHNEVRFLGILFFAHFFPKSGNTAEIILNVISNAIWKLMATFTLDKI